MRRLARILDRWRSIARIEGRLEKLQEAVGRIEARQVGGAGADTAWHDREFKVFSQWGEDGLIDYLVSVVGVTRRVFVEFGVESYQESNTRFLLVHRGWSGLVLDGSETCMESLRREPLYWRHDLQAQTAFVTRENIDSLLLANKVEGDIGLLSIDIDGNDYWVWEATSVIRPAIVVIEYNARFGPDIAVTIPYDPGFTRAAAHYSMIYYGVSLRALWLLGRRKGYDLVGCNSAGNNAFFVRSDLRPAILPALDARHAWRPACFRESRNPDNTLAFLKPEAETALLLRLPLISVEEI